MSGNITIDLPVDLSTTDDTGLPWSLLDESPHPERIVPGGDEATAVARVVDVEDGSSTCCLSEGPWPPTRLDSSRG